MLSPYFALASFFAGIAILLGTAILVGWFDPKARAERAMRAHLEAHKRRQAAILQIFAERAGGTAKIIDGEYTAEDRFRRAGAL